MYSQAEVVVLEYRYYTPTHHHQSNQVQLDASNLVRVLCCAPLDHEQPPHCNESNALYPSAAAPR
jgi:hypothetical protein